MAPDTMGSREGAPGCAGQIPPEPFGLRELVREFILPPWNPGAGVYGPLTLIDVVKMLLTLAAGGLGYWAFYGHGILWGVVGAAGAAWLWRPLLLVSGLAVVLVVDRVARICRAVVGRTSRST
jgi:hypothetical protein